jgi:hypothetical protein
VRSAYRGVFGFDCVMAIAIHPLRMLLRTDADVSPIYHAFFFAEVLPGSISLVHRIPIFRKKKVDEDLEIGLQFYLSEIAAQPFEKETFGMFVTTSSKGTIYNCFWRALESRMFIAVTSFYLFTFTRELFRIVQSIPATDLYVTLLSLCETPMLPISGMQYNINLRPQLPKLNTASTVESPDHIKQICFGTVEQQSDWTVEALAISIMNAKMLVGAWEAIVLERKVLVASKNASVVVPCCEFLRRLIHPLVLCNTYIPFLTSQIIETLDSPLPYLVGAHTDVVLSSFIDLTETVVVDLDAQEVYNPKPQTPSEVGAPPSTVARLVRELNSILVGSWTRWMSSIDSLEAEGKRTAPLAPAVVASVADRVIQLFVDCNLSLLSARALHEGVPAFFRRICDYAVEIEQPGDERSLSRESRGRSSSEIPRPEHLYGVAPCITMRKTPRIQENDMGFVIRQDAAHGMMQLIRKRHCDDMTLHFLPCWVEMDDVSLSVYEQVDEIPIMSCSVKDIYAVSPSPAEPEGLVFEIALNANKTLMFAAHKGSCRRSWMGYIEQKMRKNLTTNSLLNAENPALSPPGVTHKRASNPAVDPSFVHANNSSSSTAAGAGMGPSDGSSGGAGADDQSKTSRLGLFGLVQDRHNDLEDGEARSKYRYAVRQTQMHAYLRNLMEAGDFDEIFRKQGVKTDELAATSLQISVENYLWSEGSVQALLTRLATDTQAALPEFEPEEYAENRMEEQQPEGPDPDAATAVDDRVASFSTTGTAKQYGDSPQSAPDGATVSIPHNNAHGAEVGQYPHTSDPRTSDPHVHVDAHGRRPSVFTEELDMNSSFETNTNGIISATSKVSSASVASTVSTVSTLSSSSSTMNALHANSASTSKSTSSCFTGLDARANTTSRGADHSGAGSNASQASHSKKGFNPFRTIKEFFHVDSGSQHDGTDAGKSKSRVGTDRVKFEEENKAKLKKLLQHVAASNKRCVEELHTLYVEVDKLVGDTYRWV